MENKTDNKSKFSLTFLLLTVLFCVCLIVSNLMEIKTVSLGPLTITAGFMVFPISYILNDCIVEIYGFARARLVIWLGFAMNLLASLLLQMAVWLPGSAEWTGQDAMALVFGAAPRIFVASFTAFLCGSMVNAYVMSRMRTKAGGGGSFSLRAVVSTLWGESVDSAIFFPIAFGGLLEWSDIGALIITQAVLKTVYEILILPVTLRVVQWLRNHEGATVVDDSSSLTSWWKFYDVH
ncbi:MAG: queuosine precursor transporter [Paramuribaculum sp.]|nr:queuosine precursor transporter [Paramuribaculum sp.]